MLKNQELGVELHDRVKRNKLELDDWKILKEAQAWIERKATSYLGSRHWSRSVSVQSSCEEMHSTRQWSTDSLECRSSQSCSGDQRHSKRDDHRWHDREGHSQSQSHERKRSPKGRSKEKLHKTSKETRETIKEVQWSNLQNLQRKAKILVLPKRVNRTYLFVEKRLETRGKLILKCYFQK